MKTRTLIIVLMLMALCKALFAEEALKIDFIYPSFVGDFYLSGKVSFAPGAVTTEKNLLVESIAQAKETPTKITILRKWHDGSVLSAEIIFVANAARRNMYQLRYGSGIERRESFDQTAVLPTIAFSVGGAPKTTERVDISVGQINVRVDKSHDLYYYWHLLPIAIIIMLAYLRYKRV